MRRSVIIIALLLFMAGCESVVDFPEIPNAGQYPVIEAMLTNQVEIQKIRVSYSTSLNDSLSNLPITNARVFVSSDAGDTVVYEYTNDGWYASKPFGAQLGKNYSLSVTIDSINYQASGSLMPMNGIDSLYIKHLPYSKKDSAYYVFLNTGFVDPAVTRYYQVNIYENDSLLTRDKQLAFFSDKFLSESASLKIPYEFLENDTVKIELLSLSKEMYTYYNTLNTNILNEGLVDIGYQTNPPCMFNKSALGYFQISQKDEKTIVIRR